MKKNVLTVVVVSFVFLLACISFVPLTQSASAQDQKAVVLTASADNLQEVYANPNTTTKSSGVGFAILVLSADRTKVDYAVAFTGLNSPVGSAHFHRIPTDTPGAFGVSAGVFKTICSASTTPCAEGTIFTGQFSTLNQAGNVDTTLVNDLVLNGKFYLNIHTIPSNPSGEIRGQVLQLRPLQ